MVRRKVLLLAAAFVLTALVAFGLGLLLARSDAPHLAAPSAPPPTLVDAGPRLMLDTSKVNLLPDADLRFHKLDPPSLPAPASSP